MIIKVINYGFEDDECSRFFTKVNEMNLFD